MKVHELRKILDTTDDNTLVIIAEDRIIIKTYGTVTQTAGSVICICEKAKSITITDDDILCSGYDEVENGN